MSYRAFLFDSRYNCLLGGITHNKKRIEIQLMKGFCRDLFSDIFDKMLVKIKNERETLNGMLASNMVSLCRLSST